MSNIASAAEPITTNEVLLPADQDTTINPLAITSISGGDVIVAGSMGVNGWATRVSRKGQVLWRYDIAQLYKPRFHQAVEVRGIISMADGSTFLCGNIPRPPESMEPGAFVLHLDASGKKISEKFFSPIANASGLKDNKGSFSSCIAWGDGFAILGSSGRIVPAAGPGMLPATTKFYWILAIDAEGNLRWEKQLPKIVKSVAGIGPGVAGIHDLTFSASDSISTDLIRIDSDGETARQKSFSGYFQLVAPAKQDADLQMAGYADVAEVQRSGDTNVFVSAINAQLDQGNPTSSTVKNFLGNFYRLEDGSYFILGHRKNTFGQLKTSGVMHLDRSFEHEIYMELPRTREPAFLEGAGAADARGQSPNEFVMVRGLTQLPETGVTASTPLVFRGAVVDFLQFNH